MNVKNQLTSIPLTIFYQLCAHIVKVGLIVGSPFLFFSAANCIIPLSGLFGGGIGLILSYSLYITRTLFFSKTINYTTWLGIVSILRLPTLCASLYAMNNSAFLRSIVSISSIILFLLHTEGMHAPLYTIFLFIPLMLPLILEETPFIRFFYATLLQHAVGSVIFLYQTSMKSDVWNSLIPTVFFERLFFALCMFVVYHAMNAIMTAIAAKIAVSKQFNSTVL